MGKNKKINNTKFKIADSAGENKPCILCNPKKYLKFSFAFISYESSSPKEQDLIKMWERMRFLSRDTYMNLMFEYQTDKARWFENISIDKIKKEIPSKFREVFPSQTNEEYSVMRVYPAGTPNGTANPRIIGMIKHTVFYIFFLDWDGTLYNHGHRKQR